MRRSFPSRRGIVTNMIILLVALIVFVYFQYQKDIDQARERMNLARLAETNCGSIEYATAGSGQPVLVVHGAGGGFDQGLAVARLLIEGGFGNVKA